MKIEKDKFMMIRLNLMLALRWAKKNRDMDDTIGRLESIMEVVEEIDFFDKMEQEFFDKKDNP